MSNILAVTQSKNGRSIRLTYERWSHILESHDYMAGNLNILLDTIENPDYIVRGNKGELLAVKYHEKTNISSKYAVVVYKENDSNFILTAFFTSDLKRVLKKGIIWQK